MIYPYYIFQWITELRHFHVNTPILLVGLKIDLRNDEETILELEKTNKKPVTHSQGVKLAKQIKAVKYVECSSLTQVNTF